MNLKFPVNLFLQGIQEKKVYYFSNKNINTYTPHYYICLKRTDDDLLILSCCTSQFETVKRFIELSDLPFETLVWIKPKDGENPFIKDRYVNCNQYFSYSIDQFKQMYEQDNISFSGEISDVHFEQIIIGIKISPLIDEDIKDLLPQLD